MFSLRKRECVACTTLKELLAQSEKRNKELIQMLKHDLDSSNERNKELTDVITGRNIQPQHAVGTPEPIIRPTRRQRLRAAEVADRIRAGERDAGLATGTDGE